MTQLLWVHSASLHQMYRCTKIRNSSPYSSWETELNQKTWHKSVKSVKREIKVITQLFGVQSASFYQMYSCTNFHNSGSYSPWETELNKKSQHKFVKSEKCEI